MQQDRLKHLETIISNNQYRFYEIGQALKEIRDSRLYKLILFNTFEAYARDRWDIGRSQAYRLIDAYSYSVINNLSPIGDRLPGNKAQKHASKKSVSTRSVNQSDPILKEDIKQLYRYKCQVCSEQIKKVSWTEGLTEQQEFEFLTADAHHVDPLELNGLDAPSNIISVCPNCHRKLHTGELLIDFSPVGSSCRNQITGEQLLMTIDPDHSFSLRTD